MKKFEEFIENPTGVRYVEALGELAKTPGYHPYAAETGRIYEMIRSEQFAAAQDACRTAMATLLLSPEAHMLAAFLARKLGDSETAEMEQFLMAACVRGILGTGDGTLERPYVVSVVSDEYSVLEALETKLSSQHLIEDAGRYLDRIETAEQKQLYFDISVPYGDLQRRMSKTKPRPPDPDTSASRDSG